MNAQIKSILTAILIIGIGAAFAGTAVAQKPAAGPESHNATVLGGGTRFTPPIKDLAALQKMFARPRLQTDLRKAFAEAGVESVTDQFLKAIAEGTVKDTSVPVGSTMEWMASRTAGNLRPHVLRNVTWAGKKPFDAFEIGVPVRGAISR